MNWALYEIRSTQNTSMYICMYVLQPFSRKVTVTNRIRVFCTWLLFLVNLCFLLSVTELSSDKDFKQILEDDITERGYSADGETSSSGSEKGVLDSDDELNKTGTWKGKEKTNTKLKKSKNGQKNHQRPLTAWKLKFRGIFFGLLTLRVWFFRAFKAKTKKLRLASRKKEQYD